jgi:hypothetical protein
MKKRRIKINLIGILLLFLCISLSGCTQQSSDKDKFIGTWITEIKTNPMGGNYTETRVFLANGSYYTTNLGLGHIPGSWHLTDGNLIIDTYYPSTYLYTFSANNTVLHLTSVSSNVIENLTKQL